MRKKDLTLKFFTVLVVIMHVAIVLCIRWAYCTVKRMHNQCQCGTLMYVPSTEGFAVLPGRGTHSMERNAVMDVAPANSPHPISTPSTLTVIRMGNGEMPVAFVMSGTAVRPFSDEVWVSMTWRAFVRVLARVVLNS